jgi:hypothetical protein
MEHPLKPLLQIVEVVVEVFLKILPNIITLKTSTTRCFPCSVDLISKFVDLETLNLIKLCLTSSLFSFKNIFYEQTEGTMMRSSLSLVVENI